MLAHLHLRSKEPRLDLSESNVFETFRRSDFEIQERGEKCFEGASFEPSD
jgi:hypothetical protein